VARIVIDAKPFFDIVELLGIGRSGLVRAEQTTRISGTFQVSGQMVSKLSKTSIDSFVKAYGDSAKISVRLGDLEEFVVQAGQFSEKSLTALISSAATTPTYDIVLTIEKSSLIKNAADANNSVVLFFQLESLMALLSRSVRAIEDELWPETQTSLTAFVLDSNVDISGTLLSVVGPVLALTPTLMSAEVQRALNDASQASTRRERYIGWDSELRTSLTPWHFYVEPSSTRTEIGARIEGIFLQLAVLFTCDRARSIPATGGIATTQAEYRGREHVSFVPIRPSDPVSPATHPQIRSVKSLLDWCYQNRDSESGPGDWLAERLPFVQMRIAQSLEGRNETDRFHVFATSMPEILEGAQWHWRAFIEGRVTDYLNNAKQLEDTVATAVDSYATKTTELTKGLSDAVLAAVVVVIGSFIAAAFSTPFNARLFRIGVLIYATYVVLFPGIIGLLASRGNAQQVTALFAAQQRQFESSLYPEKVKSIVNTRVEKARQRFDRWWVFSAICYAVVGVTASVGAFVLPGVIK
jgi:hypothetical protein